MSDLRASFVLGLLVALPLVGCVATDTDEDGVSGRDEQRLGTDGALSDSDGDGLDDGEELTAGTNPLASDTDSDGYGDAEEVDAGTDPLDAEDVIYLGGWPYNIDKGELAPKVASPGAYDAYGTADPGVRIPRIRGLDQHGDLVDLYDLSMQGKPILIDVSTVWCPPCRAMAEWLEGENETYFFANNVRDAVGRGDVLWVTILVQDLEVGEDATGATVTAWHEQYPHPNVPVLVDHEQAFNQWLGVGFYPATLWVNEDMTVESMSTIGGRWALMDLSDSLR